MLKRIFQWLDTLFLARVRLGLDTLRTSLWFVPTLIVLGSVVLAYALLGVDAALPTDWWTQSAGLDRLLDVRIGGATAMLQMIGSSIITIAGVVFSITIAAITLAAGQYTSRVLRNFIRDRANQTVLGSFLGIFVYCMLVLRSLSGTSEADHAPALAMLMALLLAFIGIGLLIFFIHHIVKGLQAANVVAAIAHDVLPAIDRHFPERFEPPVENHVNLERPESGYSTLIRAHRSGYVTDINYDYMVGLADDCGALIRVRCSAGFFVGEGEIIAELQSRSPPDDDIQQDIRAAWSFSTQRTMANDPSYGLRQLVDVALKALSPGVNETTTGVMCVNWLGVVLLRLSNRRFPAQIRTRDNHVRVITNQPRLGDFIALAFDQIRQSAAGNVAVLQRLIEVLQALAEGPGAHVARQPILHQADAIEALVEYSVPWGPDRQPLYALLEKLRENFGAERKADLS